MPLENFLLKKNIKNQSHFRNLFNFFNHFLESDRHRLSQRQKQIDFGKNSIGYLNYIKAMPREKRTRTHPWTPNIHKKASKRSWDSMVRTWRRQLHNYDPSFVNTNYCSSLDEDDIEYINNEIQKIQNENLQSENVNKSKNEDLHKIFQDENSIFSFNQNKISGLW